jgi:hypothetical protein
MKFVSDCLRVALIGFCCATTNLHAEYSIQTFRIAGGGALNGSGGAYTLSGTIGQPEALGFLTGEPYSAIGGFWASPLSISNPAIPMLDVEQLKNGDIRVFWPLPATRLVLDQADSLTGTSQPNAWTQVAFPYQTNASHVFIIVPPTKSRFYRLKAR